MEQVRAGRRAWVKLDDLHRENLIEVVDEFGIGDLDDNDLDHLNLAWHRLEPWPDAVAGLERLKRKFILATLSNGNVALMVNMAKRAGLPWDVILGAEVAGAYKPQPRSLSTERGAIGARAGAVPDGGGAQTVTWSPRARSAFAPPSSIGAPNTAHGRTPISLPSAAMT